MSNYQVNSDDRSIGNKICRLYISDADNPANVSAKQLMVTRQAMGLVGAVQLCVENEEESLQFLRQCVDSSVTVAEPYLEVCISGCSAVVLYFRGDDIEREMEALSQQMYYQ